MKKRRSTTQSEFLRSCIQESFFALLEDGTVDQVSITDIARNAGVSRMTIYRYYHDKEDIIRSHVKETYEGYLNMVGKSGLNAVALAPFFFDYFRRNAKTIKLLIKRNLFHYISEHFAEYVEEFSITVNQTPGLSDRHNRYHYAYTAAGMLSMVRIWIDNGMKESNEEMADILKSVKLAQTRLE